MICKRGEIVLIKFPFTTLLTSKKRPVLVIKDANGYGDFVCFQSTSKNRQLNTCKIEIENLSSGELKLRSYVKYDKCFTLNSELVEKKLAVVTDVFLNDMKQLFCNEL